MNVADIIPLQRIPDAYLVLVCLYFPLGILLVLFRICLTINFLCSQIVFNVICSKDNIIRRSYERIILLILGVVVVQNNAAHTKSILISNMLTKVDGVFVSVLCNTSLVNQCYLPKFIKKVFRIHVDGEPGSQLLYPESYPTGGNSLLKFSGLTSSSADMQIQPVAMNFRRYLPIFGTTLESSIWSDLFWMYFSFLNIYDVTFLPVMHKQSDESVKEFGVRIRQKIADKLDISCSSFDASDVEELIRRRRFEARKPQQHLRMSASSPPLIREMVQQVKDVLPHVPTSVIVKDIEKTRSVDVTVTNLLEGVVEFVPEPQQTAQSSSKKISPLTKTLLRPTKQSSNQQSTFESRKEEFINRARENYLKKHGYI